MTSRSALPLTCSNSSVGTPWARMTSVPPSTWSARSAVRMPRSDEVGLDARVVDQLAEGGDLLALVARVLGLVDRQAHAIAEAGALGDADLGSGCGGHRSDSTVRSRYIRIYAPSAWRRWSGQQRGDLAHDPLRPSASASRSRRPVRPVRQRERLTDRGRRPGSGAASATRPGRSAACPLIPTGSERGAAAHGEQRGADLPALRAPVARARALREECRSGGPRRGAWSATRWAARSPSPRRTKIDPGLRRQPAEERPALHLVLGHEVDRRDRSGGRWPSR